ncbi:hypothetical protein HETIRDRAFT_447129 [Heterobasidion irregulare TC 32-1]|uniref:SAP domain-containing protein n=1 Tax=Heterobasidion irregulare (strain TC 32-1) TaxID=747525 RepID=W4JN65_HETIT|nr:uncharacterized protein HETIRDRAFT_447129 [Heterobasidion irregulare TC 32-1]ETW74914.1 hypothetical protein HETIRDRAFT_447129 [Heterobasidion irregulare TC 32-1]
MDATALNQLTYPKLQKLAQSHGVKANRKKVTIIQDLLDRYPDGVPSAPSQTRRATRPREPPIAPLPSENVAGPSVPRGTMSPPPPATEVHRASRPAAGPPSPRRDVASPRPEITSPSPRPDATPVMPPRFRTGVGRSRSATHDSPVPQANAGPIPQALFPAGDSPYEPHPAPPSHGNRTIPANTERENERGARSPMRRPRSTHRDTRSPVYRSVSPPPFAPGPARSSHSRHHLPPQPQSAPHPYSQPYPQSQWYPNLNPYSSLYPPSQPPPVHQSYTAPHYPHLPPLHLPPYAGALPHWSHDSNAYPQGYPIIPAIPPSFGMGSSTRRGETVADTAAMRQLTETMQYVAELNQAAANMLPGITQAADRLNDQVTRYRDQVRAEGAHRMRLQEMLTRFVHNSGNGEVGQAADEDSWRRGHGEGPQAAAEQWVAEQRRVEAMHGRASRQAASPGLVRAGQEILDSLDLQAAVLPPAPASPRGVAAEAIAAFEAAVVAPFAPTHDEAVISREETRESAMGHEDAREASVPREDNRESDMAREDDREASVPREDDRESAIAREDDREASLPRENDEPDHGDSHSHPGSPNPVEEEGGPMPVSPKPWSRYDQVYTGSIKSSSGGSWRASSPFEDHDHDSFPGSPLPSAHIDPIGEDETTLEREPTPEREVTPSAHSGSSPRGVKRKRYQPPSEPLSEPPSQSPSRSSSRSPSPMISLPSDMLTPPSEAGATIYDGKPEPGDEEDLGSASSGSVDRFGTFKRRRLVGSVASSPDNDRGWTWGVAEMRRLVTFGHVDEDIPRGYDSGDERLSSDGDSTESGEVFGLGESSDDEY